MDMTMKSLNDAEQLDLTRCYEAFDRQSAVSRRSQALLASAGMDAPARRWFVVVVASGKDAEVSSSLDQARIERWTAEEVEKRPRRNGRTGPRPVVARLAFPGYVFVRVAATHAAWAALSGINGVVGLLGVNGRPTPIADAAVQEVRDFLSGDADVAADVLVAGDRVRIADGPFERQRGAVKGVDKKGFALLEILLFGRAVPVTVDIAQLQKL